MKQSSFFYKLETDAEGKQFVIPKVNDQSTFFQMFDGRPFSNEWKPIELKVISMGDSGETLSITDNYYLAAHLFVINNLTIEVLSDFIKESGELLSVKCSGKNVKLFNCTNLVDGVDESLSDIVRFGDGRILTFRRLVLNMTKCTGNNIFRLLKDPLGGVYVSDVFLERVNVAELKGFTFKKIE